MGDYAKVKSKFIKEKLKSANWKKDKKYIDDLIFIEEIITGRQTMSWMGSFKWNGLKGTKEFHIIYKELAPKEYARIKTREKKEIEEEKKEEARERRLEKKEREQDKKDWMKMGGRV